MVLMVVSTYIFASMNIVMYVCVYIHIYIYVKKSMNSRTCIHVRALYVITELRSSVERAS